MSKKAQNPGNAPLSPKLKQTGVALLKTIREHTYATKTTKERIRHLKT